MTSSYSAVELFSTSILSNHKIRSRHERYTSILAIKKIPYIYHDLASDEEAKSRWRRKARDPQIPGLLVHNEWRGTFEEFEESVEFGELDLFLKIDPIRAQHDAQLNVPATTRLAASSTNPSETISSSSDSFISASSSNAPARGVSHPVKSIARLAQPKAPSQNNLAPALPFAPAGTGKRKDHDAESFLTSLGISDLNLTEEELNEILDAGKSSSGDDKAALNNPHEGGASSQRYPNSLGIGTLKPPVQRTYIPSADAGVKPLQLPRMGHDSQRSASSSTSPLRITPSARYNASQTSSKALAAEAQASISSRSFSSVKLRDAVSRGDKLQDAFKSTREASGNVHKEHIVGREDLDELMSSLGLDDVQMTEEEAEAFLLDGSIPSGLDTHNSRSKEDGKAKRESKTDAVIIDPTHSTKAKDFSAGDEGDNPQTPSQAPQLESNAVLTKVQAPVETIREPAQVDDHSGTVPEKHIETKNTAEPIEGKEGVANQDEDMKEDATGMSDEAGKNFEEKDSILPIGEISSKTEDSNTVLEPKEMNVASFQPHSGQSKFAKDVSTDSDHNEMNSQAAAEPVKPLKASTEALPEVKSFLSSDVKREVSSEQPQVDQSKTIDAHETVATLPRSVLGEQIKGESNEAETSTPSIQSTSTDELIKEVPAEKTMAIELVKETVAEATTEKKTPIEKPTPLQLEEVASNFSTLDNNIGFSEESVEKEVEVNDSDKTPLQGDTVKNEITPTVAKLEPAHIIDKPSTVSADSKNISLPSSSALRPSSQSGDVPAVEFASPTTIPSSPSAAAAFSSSPPNPANLSPITARRRESSGNSRSSSSRRAMDLPRRQSSSNDALSDTSVPSPQLGTSPIMSPKGSDERKSSMNGAKKFFGGLGRRKGRSSSNNSKKSEEEDDDEVISTLSPDTSFDPGQKRISAILREADAAMEGLDDESIENSHDSIMSDHAFNSEPRDEIAEVDSRPSIT